jgi:hypothetical protein
MTPVVLVRHAHEMVPPEANLVPPSETHLFMNVQLPEDLGRIKKVLVFKNPIRQLLSGSHLARGAECLTYFLPLNANNGKFSNNANQYPLMRNRKVKKACTAASGTM